MKARVQKWGNSLGLRIPKPFAQEVGLELNSEVEVSVEGGKIVIKPVEGNLTLDDLLARVTADNLHGEIHTGAPVGNEAW